MAIETYIGKPDLEQGVVVTDQGPALSPMFPFDERFLDKRGSMKGRE